MAATTIDEKRNSQSNPANFKAFGYGLINTFITTALVIAIGCIGLYTCKVAQANVLPDLKTPLDVSRQVEKIALNGHVIKEYDYFGLGWLFFQSPTRIASQKIAFDNAEIQRGFYRGIVGQLMSRRENGNYWLFFSNIVNHLIEFNGTILNNTFPTVHAYLPEWLIVVLYAIAFPFLLIGMGFVNGIATAVAFLAQTWAGDLTKPVSEGAWTGWIGYFWRLGWAFLLWFFVFVPMSIVWGFTTIYGFIEPLTVLYTLNGKHKSFWSFLGEFFMFEKLFLVLMTYGVVNQAQQNLGGVYTVSAWIGVVVAVLMGLYRNKVPEMGGFTDGLVSYAKAHVKKGRVMSLDVISALVRGEN